MAWWQTSLITLGAYQLVWTIIIMRKSRLSGFSAEDALFWMLGPVLVPLFVLVTPYRRWGRYTLSRAYYIKHGITRWEYLRNPSKAQRKAEAWNDEPSKN